MPACAFTSFTSFPFCETSLLHYNRNVRADGTLNGTIYIDTILCEKYMQTQVIHYTFYTLKLYILYMQTHFTAVLFF